MLQNSKKNRKNKKIKFEKIINYEISEISGKNNFAKNRENP